MHYRLAPLKVDPVTTKFTQRLQAAKQELGLSNRRIVEAAAKGGHSISDYTVTTCLNGKHGNVTRTTVQALAYALRIPEQELATLAGHAEWHRHLSLEGQLQVDADSLTKVQADAVAEIIRQLAGANRKAVGNHEGSSSSMTAPDDKVAQFRPEDRPVTRKFTPRWELDEEAANEGDDDIGVDEIPDDSP